MKKSIFLYLLAPLLLFSTCKSDDDSTSDYMPTPGINQSFSCLIDGESFVANLFLYDDEMVSSSDGYTKTASGSYVSGGDTLTVRIHMTAPSLSDFTEGASFDSNNGSDSNGCSGIIFSSSEDVATITPGTEEPIASAIITALDNENEVFSGSFEFEYYNPITESTQLVTEGTFTNIAY